MVAPMVARSKKPLARRVPLVVKIEGATEVKVTGDFNSWKEDGIKL